MRPRWTLRLPFLLLPVALVVRAPDIAGGFALHLRVALALAAFGALLDVAVARRPALGRVARHPFTRAASLAAIGLGAFVLSTVASYGLVSAFEIDGLVPDAWADSALALVAVSVWGARRVARGAPPLAWWTALALVFDAAVATHLAGWLRPLPWVLAFVAAGLALRIPEKPGTEPPVGLRAAGFLALGLAAAPAGAIAARYAAPFAGVGVTGSTVAIAGALLAGLGVGVGSVLRWPRRLDPVGLCAGEVLAVLGLPLVIYLAIFYALTPRLFAMTGLAIAAPSLMAGRRRPAAALTIALWSWFYVGFAWITVFKAGPDAGQCAAVIAHTDARSVMVRHGDDPDRVSAQPYDLVLDPATDSLVVTFKRIDVRGGFVDVVPSHGDGASARLTVRRPDASGPLWPERFVRDPATGLYYFGMLGHDAFSLWEVAVGTTSGGAPEIRTLRDWPLAYEPAYPAIDESRHALVQPYLAGQVEDAPLLEVLDLEDPRPGARELRDVPGAMAEYVAVDPTSGDYIVPVSHHGLAFLLLRVSGEKLAPLWRRETYHPTIGLAVDPEHARLYATNPMAGTVVLYGLDDLLPIASLHVGAFPRDVELDRARGLLYVGNYSDGTVVVLDVSSEDGAPVEVARHPVGSLLRGITLDPGSGRVHAASACGVFEIPTPDRPVAKLPVAKQSGALL